MQSDNLFIEIEGDIETLNAIKNNDVYFCVWFKEKWKRLWGLSTPWWTYLGKCNQLVCGNVIKCTAISLKVWAMGYVRKTKVEATFSIKVSSVVAYHWNIMYIFECDQSLLKNSLADLKQFCAILGIFPFLVAESDPFSEVAAVSPQNEIYCIKIHMQGAFIASLQIISHLPLSVIVVSVVR